MSSFGELLSQGCRASSLGRSHTRGVQTLEGSSGVKIPICPRSDWIGASVLLSSDRTHLVFICSLDQFQRYCARFLATAFLKHIMLPERCRRGQLQPGSASQTRAACWIWAVESQGAINFKSFFWMVLSDTRFLIYKIGKIFILYYQYVGPAWEVLWLGEQDGMIYYYFD